MKHSHFIGAGRPRMTGASALAWLALFGMGGYASPLRPAWRERAMPMPHYNPHPRCPYAAAQRKAKRLRKMRRAAARSRVGGLA